MADCYLYMLVYRVASGDYVVLRPRKLFEEERDRECIEGRGGSILRCYAIPEKFSRVILLKGADYHLGRVSLESLDEFINHLHEQT